MIVCPALLLALVFRLLIVVGPPKVMGRLAGLVDAKTTSLVGPGIMPASVPPAASIDQLTFDCDRSSQMLLTWWSKKATGGALLLPVSEVTVSFNDVPLGTSVYSRRLLAALVDSKGVTAVPNENLGVPLVEE